MLSFRTLATVFGELVAPSACAGCDEAVSASTLFCPACALSAERVAPAPDVPLAAFEYGGAIAVAVTRLKYEGRVDLAARLGRSMLCVATHLLGALDLVVPVPLHPRRLAHRGYNQAALLAAPIARELGARLAPRALLRTRDTPRQASADNREARLVNVAGAFVARERSRIDGARVLLIDDVRTTGATLEACSSALEAAGAARVLSLVLARRA